MDMPKGLFFNKAKRFRWNPRDSSLNDNVEDLSLPFEVSECMNKISRSQYMQDLSQLKEVQLDQKSIYAMATSFMGPNYFWLQYSQMMTKEPDSMYSSIIKSINSTSHYKQKSKRYNYNEVGVGLGCCAQFKDGSWYRALVTQKIGDDYMKILYPDYGNSEVVALEELAKPVQSHFSVPIQAFCACLYNVKPKHQDQWKDIGDRMKKFFEQHVDDDLIVKVKKVRSDYVVECDIFLVRPGDEKNPNIFDKLHRRHIAQAIVDEGLAYFVDPDAAYATIKEKIETINNVNSMKQPAAYKNNIAFNVPTYNCPSFNGCNLNSSTLNGTTLNGHTFNGSTNNNSIFNVPHLNGVKIEIKEEKVDY